jgi:CRP-like cAMP-binding protein
MAEASTHQFVELFLSGRQKRYSTGDIIMQGQEPSGVMHIDSGFVKVYSISDDGNKYVHIIYKAGEIFPLIWALKDIRRRVFYEAASAVSIHEIPKSTFLEFTESSAQNSNEVLMRLADQFYVYADRLDNLQYKPARERTAYRLLFLASRFGQPRGANIVIKAPTTHELIAESINLARETVSREIEQFEKNSLIRYDRHELVITDVNGLANEISEPITLDLWGLKIS